MDAPQQSAAPREASPATTPIIATPMGLAPRCALSVVLLTLNEQRNISACLEALARQSRMDFEVIVIDAASIDRTAELVRAAAPTFPVPLRLEVAPTRISVGAARNRGIALADAPTIAYLSADTEPDPEWVEHAIHSTEHADVVYGRQIHAPTVHNIGSAVRGLRYHFPDGPTEEPERYASNVNAAIRRSVLNAFPFGTTPSASAVDDILLTHRAVTAGYRIHYNPEMVVRHRDVDSWRAEMIKNRREGLGLGEFAHELGLQKAVLTWGAILAAALGLLLLRPNLYSLLILAIVLWIPTVRRVVRRARDMSARDLLLGSLASPVFDVAFLLAYVRGLLTRKNGSHKPPRGREVET